MNKVPIGQGQHGFTIESWHIYVGKIESGNAWLEYVIGILSSVHVTWRLCS